MKILDYSLREDGMLVVTTDNPGRPEFVYESDRFDSLNALYAEIERSIAFEVARKQKKEAKLSKLAAELDVEKDKNKEVEP